MTNPDIPMLLQEEQDQFLRDALVDLRRAPEEAQEERFSPPAQTTLANAEGVLNEMFKIQPQRFEVYPMPEGQIAIDAANQRGSSVILLCEPDGGALCSVNVKGEHRRKRYGTVKDLPDEFLCAALAEVANAE